MVGVVWSVGLMAGLVIVAAVLWLVRRIRTRRAAWRVARAWGEVRLQDSDLDRLLQDEAWQEERARDPAPGAVDAQTWSDLGMDEVVEAVDRTWTGLGRQALYRRLRSGVRWTSDHRLEVLTRRVATDKGFRDELGTSLALSGRRLGLGFWVITRPDLVPRKAWYWAFPVLALTMAASLVAIPFTPWAILVAALVGVVNLCTRIATSWHLPGVLTPMRQLSSLIGAGRRLHRLLDQAGVESGLDRRDLRRLWRLKRVAGWVSRDEATSSELLASLWEYLNSFFLLDANALLYTSRRLEHLAPVLRRVATGVGEVDLAVSVASLRSEPRSWCMPDFDARLPTAGVRILEMWHPLLEDPVSNDAELEPGAGIVITGANMSGKSTYLRTLGVAAVLARSLGTCPARRWEGPVLRVRSLMARSDDLAAGKSYYQVEADVVVSLLEASREEEPTLFLLDELLRGTNTTERLAAGEAVLRALIEAGSPHTVVVATHDGELVTLLADLYAARHFRETVTPGGLVFDYICREGPAQTRTAIALLESTGAPEAVIRAARARARQLDEASR